ncbi:hypothetical protein GNI_062060 [Gregarina niphandrodes]|uniref:Uncharacterized protein n=1 Tax=Gregarina niphandrodes TaxID=110365 RepID=A0A023B8B6_GRENI|nr:hypothetical protein GNI_062060 [Gregarina niphandrodes]EZG68562.1 hypothetical protein GNI_062060 [Gregarina niphandrodes]|eukprot:XP_011134569.1 hypothetical protein GNI_062060 [Gregarina niphandrodes]
MLGPQGHIKEAVSVVYASRTKADHNEPIVPPGQLAKICAQEELRWSADTIPIRSHGTKDLSTATRRVGLARVKAACQNYDLLRTYEGLGRSPSRSINLAE